MVVKGNFLESPEVAGGNKESIELTEGKFQAAGRRKE
jgi:hypothetical protein